MLSCPRRGKCENCVHVRSMAVGNNQQDRVLACTLNGASLIPLGYDGRYGNRPTPVVPLSSDCFELAKGVGVSGGWRS